MRSRQPDHADHQHGPKRVGETLDAVTEIPDQLMMLYKVLRISHGDHAVIKDRKISDSIRRNMRSSADESDGQPYPAANQDTNEYPPFAYTTHFMVLLSLRYVFPKSSPA